MTAIREALGVDLRFGADQGAKIKAGVAAAAVGDFASTEEVEAGVARYGRPQAC